MSQVTITAKTGPAIQVTTQVIANVTDINFDLAHRELDVVTSDGIIHEFDLVGVTAVTYTISGSTYTVVVS